MATEDVALVTLPPDTVVSGAVPLVSLRVTSDELAQRADVEWHAVEDELGLAGVAVVQTGGGVPPFVLMEYAESPGVVVLGVPDAEDSALDRLLSVLAIRESEIEDGPGETSSGTRPEDLTVALAMLRLRVDEFASELSALRNEPARKRGRGTPSTVNLTPGQRDALALVANGHSYDEIARMLQMSPAAVRARVARARRRLSNA
jgi:DNA-binding CsgD family transcriptional regulator